jgi:hypothetical protein
MFITLLFKVLSYFLRKAQTFAHKSDQNTDRWGLCYNFQNIFDQNGEIFAIVTQNTSTYFVPKTVILLKSPTFLPQVGKNRQKMLS